MKEFYIIHCRGRGRSHLPPERTRLIDSARMCCNTVWVPHPRDTIVFVARVGEHDANLLDRINNRDSATDAVLDCQVSDNLILYHRWVPHISILRCGKPRTQ